MPSLPNTLTTALKEWAVVQRALLEGHQIVLLRKGGLIEETGDFDLKAETFLLYPTYEHETERLGDVQPRFGQWLREEEARKPLPAYVRFETAASVTDIVRVDDREKLANLMPQHIWSKQFIDGRFDWEPYKPVFLLFLRVYVLEAPLLVEFRQEYGGCRSWIDLANPLSTKGAKPVISDANYDERRALTQQFLSR
jgi:hypothetical protein